MNVKFENYVNEYSSQHTTIDQYREFCWILRQAQNHCKSLDVLQEKLNKAALSWFWVYRGGSHIAIHQLNIQKNEPFEERVVIITEEPTPEKQFPNGFTSWKETHHEVVSFLTSKEKDGTEFQARNEQGTGGMYELAESLTDEFETMNKDREWDGEFFDEIEEFLTHKFKKVVHVDCKSCIHCALTGGDFLGAPKEMSLVCVKHVSRINSTTIAQSCTGFSSKDLGHYVAKNWRES